MRKYVPYVIISLLMSFVSCENRLNETSGIGDEIGFYVYDENYGSVGTRAVIDDTQTLESLNLPIYVTDMIGGTFNNTMISLNDKGFWKSGVQWKNQMYAFYAYIESDGSASDSYVDVKGEGGGTTVNVGYYVDMYQPKSYSSDKSVWSDYLLSYRTDNINGSRKNLVELQLERITAGVELYIAAPGGSMTKVTSVSFSDIIRAARFTNNGHAVAVSSPTNAIRNTWRYSYLDNTPVNYVYSGDRAVVNVTDDSERFDSEFRVMKFLTVPQVVKSKLHIEYQIKEKENWHSYSADFDLDTYPVKEWRSGYRTRYYLFLDSSIEVEAVIAEWNSLDYVEGVFLPKLEEDE